MYRYGCSSHLKLFLCSAYVPMCTDKVAQPIGPCRDLCQSVRSKCEPVLVEFGFNWPASLDCNLFHPENNHMHMCIPGSVQPPSQAKEPRVPETIPPVTSVFSGGVGGGEKMTEIQHGICGRRVVSRGQCWVRCGSESESLFLDGDKTFARHYVFLWAVFSLVGAVVAVVAATTFARRLSSPAERPIVYMGLSQIMYSVGAIIGLTGSSGSHCVLDKSSGLELLAKGPLVPPTCSLVFLLTYFFAVASLLWWVMLCLSWLLSMNKAFASSLEGREWSLFHLITWGLASILTCAVLLNKDVDADELTGICGVGFQDSRLLLYFHIIPLGCCVGNALLFLVAGLCVKLGRSGSHYQYVGRLANFTNVQQKRLTEKSRATWNRVLIFSLVHLLPYLCVLATMAYEMKARGEWEAGLSKANVQLFLLRHNVNLIVGLTSCVWIMWLYSSKSWLDMLTGLKERLTCDRFLKETRSCSTGTSSANGSLNPHLRSLPAIPEERVAMSCEVIRTETWRRGETIV
ncbi:unnamed protein product [Allacma fusca]|uniref:Frizzled-4 n=1 Tax=Allacma fusca TaxID=39272 RepID=A0A8J2PMY5_9HEXA|nr:unnamed protein product [Allacma fusca]